MMNDDSHIHIIFPIIHRYPSVASDYPTTSLMLHSFIYIVHMLQTLLKLQICRRVKNINKAHQADQYLIL